MDKQLLCRHMHSGGLYFSLLASLLKLRTNFNSYNQADSGMAEAARPSCSFSSVKSLGEVVLSSEAPPPVKQEAGLLVAFSQ